MSNDQPDSAAAAPGRRWPDPGACLARSTAAALAGPGGRSPQVCGHADGGPAAVAGSGPGQRVTVSGCAGQAACSSAVMATVTPRACRPWMWVRVLWIFAARGERTAASRHCCRGIVTEHPGDEGDNPEAHFRGAATSVAAAEAAQVES